MHGEDTLTSVLKEIRDDLERSHAELRELRDTIGRNHARIEARLDEAQRHDASLEKSAEGIKDGILEIKRAVAEGHLTTLKLHESNTKHMEGFACTMKAHAELLQRQGAQISVVCDKLGLETIGGHVPT